MPWIFHVTTNVIKFFTLCWCCTYYDNSIVHCLPILFFQRRHRRVLAESQHQYNHTGLSLPKVSMNPSFHTSSFGNHYNAHNPSASTVSLLPSLSSTYKAPKVPHSTTQVPHSTTLVITVSQSMFEG